MDEAFLVLDWRDCGIFSISVVISEFKIIINEPLNLLLTMRRQFANHMQLLLK